MVSNLILFLPILFLYLNCSEVPIKQVSNLKFDGDVIIEENLPPDFLQDFHDKGFEVINGSLIILNADGVNLDLLNNVKIVTNMIEISDTLTSLDFLDNLTEVEDLTIYCISLLEGEALKNLRMVGGSMILIGNYKQSRTEPIESSIIFPKLDSVKGQLFLGLKRSTKVCLFPKLKYAESISIIDGVSGSLEFFPTLQNTNEIELNRCMNLTIIKGVNSLEEVDVIILRSLPNMVSIEGLKSLKKCKELIIVDNPELKNLNGLENLEVITGYLRIEHNNALNNYCSLKPRSVQSLVSMGNAFVINGNGYNPTYEMLVDGQCSAQ